MVDMSLVMCTCPLNGVPCKHQYACMKQFGIHTHNFHPNDDKEMRASLDTQEKLNRGEEEANRT